MGISNTSFKKGHIVPDKWREAVANAHKGKNPWNKGTKGIMKAWNKGKHTGIVPRSSFKKGFTPWNKGQGTRSTTYKIFKDSIEFKIWRKTIFERDNYTCQICKKRGGELNADHIKRYADYPALRLDLNNGRTLCHECHLKTPTFGNRLKRLQVLSIC